MEKGKWLVFIAIICLLNGFNESLADSWYDYGDGKINLSNVTFIMPRISISYYPSLTADAKGRFDSMPAHEKSKIEKEGGILSVVKNLKAQGGTQALKGMVNKKCLNLDFGKWINVLSENDIKVVIDSFKDVDLKCYEGVRVNAYVMFDDFNLNLYEFSKEKNLNRDDIDNIKDGLNKALKKYDTLAP